MGFNKEVIKVADKVILSVKPQFYPTVIQEVKDCIRENQIVITIAPGKTLEWLEEQFGKPVKLIRTMPNTPAMVGEGMTAVCANSYVTEGELKEVLQMLGAFGTSDGCGCFNEWKLAGIYFYVNRSDGRCSCSRWNGTCTGI